jgi:uncharacterized protein YunC (DUF1805 family)
MKLTLARMIYYILKKENKPMTEQAIEAELANYISNIEKSKKYTDCTDIEKELINTKRDTAFTVQTVEKINKALEEIVKAGYAEIITKAKKVRKPRKHYGNKYYTWETEIDYIKYYKAVK